MLEELLCDFCDLFSHDQSRMDDPPPPTDAWLTALSRQNVTTLTGTGGEVITLLPWGRFINQSFLTHPKSKYKVVCISLDQEKWRFHGHFPFGRMYKICLFCGQPLAWLLEDMRWLTAPAPSSSSLSRSPWSLIFIHSIICQLPFSPSKLANAASEIKWSHQTLLERRPHRAGGSDAHPNVLE